MNDPDSLRPDDGRTAFQLLKTVGDVHEYFAGISGDELQNLFYALADRLRDLSAEAHTNRWAILELEKRIAQLEVRTASDNLCQEIEASTERLRREMKQRSFTSNPTCPGRGAHHGEGLCYCEECQP